MQRGTRVLLIVAAVISAAWREPPSAPTLVRVPSRPPRRSLAARVRSGLRAFLLSDELPQWLWRTPGVGQPVTSGVTVTDQTALRVTAVLSCVKVLAESISTLPLTRAIDSRITHAPKSRLSATSLSSPLVRSLCYRPGTWRRGRCEYQETVTPTTRERTYGSS